jgi:xanthine dehydrogenase accessory factor
MEMSHIWREAEACGQRAVLATVIAVEGHAYRKTGASMLLMEDGTTLGSISPGCMESDLLARVSSVLESAVPIVVDYDFRSEDDLMWGEHVGCGGEVRVLLESMSGSLLEHVQEGLKRLDEGKAVALARWISRNPMHVKYRLFSSMPEERPNRHGLQIEADEETYVSYLLPQPRLIIFGAGNDAVPVAKMAVSTGFRTVVADWREGLLARERFPDVERLLGLPGDVLKELQLKESDYVVVMSHQLRRDHEFLQLVAPYKLRYVGIMGSSARSARLLEGISPPQWFHYPVGLDIGAEGPDEIAVSILAELIQIRRGGDMRQDKDGGHEEVCRGDLFSRWKKQTHAASQAFH